jgi:hypothetical protein
LRNVQNGVGNPHVTVDTNVDTSTSVDGSSLIVNFVDQTDGTIVGNGATSGTQGNKPRTSGVLVEHQESIVGPVCSSDGHGWDSNTSVSSQPEITIVGETQTN